MVFVGMVHAPEGEWPKPPYTKVAQTPVVREKPFLMVDETATGACGFRRCERTAWGLHGATARLQDARYRCQHFYIAHAGTDTAATINAQLKAGKNLLLTPGIYKLSEPIRVTRAETIVLGLGFATLMPVNGTAAVTTDDVDGIDRRRIIDRCGGNEVAGPDGGWAAKAARPATRRIPSRCTMFSSAWAERAWGAPKVNLAREQQRHDHRPHVDMARRSRLAALAGTRISAPTAWW